MKNPTTEKIKGILLLQSAFASKEQIDKILEMLDQAFQKGVEEGKRTAYLEDMPSG